MNRTDHLWVFVVVFKQLLFPPWPLKKKKRHCIKDNYEEKCRHLSELVVWDLKCSCWQFSHTVGHCGAGRFCSEPQRPAWRLRVLPYVGPLRCQQQMCWTTRLKPWTPCLGRGCVCEGYSHEWRSENLTHAHKKKKISSCLCVRS